MKSISKLPFLFCLLFLSKTAASQNGYKSWSQPHVFPQNKIQLTLIYEGLIDVNGMPAKSYSLSWIDTIGQTNNFDKHNRPYELKVVVRTEDSIVGRYTGLSTQMTHCTFITNDQMVSIHFWLEKNVFYRREMSGEDSLSGMMRIDPDNNNYLYWNRVNFNRKEYAPMSVNLREVNDNNIVEEFNKKEVILQPNSNVICLYNLAMGALNPDPMPNSNMGLATGLRQVIASDRYLLDAGSCKIFPGKVWLRKKGISYTAELDLRVIDPQLRYAKKSGEIVTGRSLIKHKKIIPEEFDLSQFNPLMWSLPYSIP